VADWYVSSATYASVPVWAATTGYSVGQFVKPTAPAVGARYVYRVTIPGTSGATEPNWATATANNDTIVSGGVTFTNVTGQSAYGWSAAAGTLLTFHNNNTRALVGDRVFLASDHVDNGISTSYAFNWTTQAFGLLQIISVNRAGSVPPVAADVQAGAQLIATANNNLLLDPFCHYFWQGITITLAGTGGSLSFANSGTRGHYFKNCTLQLTNTGSAARIGSTDPAKVILDNTTIEFGNFAQGFSSAYPLELIWINTPAAIQGSVIPNALFQPGGGSSIGTLCTCRGVDLSAITTSLVVANGSYPPAGKYLFESCRIAPAVIRYALSNVGTGTTHLDEVELVNCFDGTKVVNERYTLSGSIITDRITYLSGGAQDDIGLYSLKLVSGTRADKAMCPLDCFSFDVENTVIGASKTATLELISSASLNNDDISVLFEYMGTVGSSIASLVNSLPATLTAGSALPTSGATWISPPATPVKQQLQVTFTPQRAGRVRGLVRLGKISATVWVNPQITIS
jgi:hypothetical protein